MVAKKYTGRLWDRNLWAVVHTSPTHDDKGMILGDAWHANRDSFYPGEASRTLLFNTRADARAWCYNKHKDYADRDDFVAKWKFTPIRVRVTVTPCSSQQRQGDDHG